MIIITPYLVVQVGITSEWKTTYKEKAYNKCKYNL